MNHEMTDKMKDKLMNQQTKRTASVTANTKSRNVLLVSEIEDCGVQTMHSCPENEGSDVAEPRHSHRWLWICVSLLISAQVASFTYFSCFHEICPCPKVNSDATHPAENINTYPFMEDIDDEARLLFPPPPSVPSEPSGLELERNRRSSQFSDNDGLNEPMQSTRLKAHGRKPRSEQVGANAVSSHGSQYSTTSIPIGGAPGIISQANVEFVSPKFREEYLSSSPSSASGSSNSENPWVWLNAYSRIPVNAIQEFCSATKEYCPPGPDGPTGPPGAAGVRGPVGERGDRGPPGEPGIRGPVGPVGPMGPKGPKGDIGKTGLPGLNGRDGVPGEPGLDGVPGRSGTPGIDGVPGIDGLPGQPGSNGLDGNPGMQGATGEPGPVGPQGLTGPRGKPGRSGIPGIPGVPGINAWLVNSTDPRRRDVVLIPPSIPTVIIGGEVVSNTSRTVVIREGENLRLRCGAAGNPRPEVSWMKADGSLTPIGSWKTSDVLGHTFNITKIHREHMGIYACVADNGIPPAAYRTFNVEVHFPPFIRTATPSISVNNGTSALLECDVEAFPESLNYWERHDGRLIDSQHRSFLREQGKYKVQMVLNLTITNPNSDYGRYHCVSKNEMGITRGDINVFDADPRFSGQPPGGHDDLKTWGPAPPDMTDLEDMCPPPIDCPSCSPPSATKCRDSGLGMFDVFGRMDIRPLGNGSYPGYANRTQDCVLSAIGKPVFHRFTDSLYGNWMRDAQPRTPADGDKYWATKFNQSYLLYEYTNKTTFKKDTPVRNYTLPFALKGYLHVVYNGSLYYHQQEESRIIRYELAAERIGQVSLPNATVSGNVYLYSQSQSYLDFSVDETGLWVIYGLQPNNNTAVAKLNPYSLELEFVWNISLNNQRAGEMFVACGVLYAVDSVTERNTKIRFALDLFRNKLLEVDLAFANPFSFTRMLGYNHRTKELYSWDKGNQLTYPVKTIDIGYNTPENDASDRLDINSGPEALVLEESDSPLSGTPI